MVEVPIYISPFSITKTVAKPAGVLWRLVINNEPPGSEVMYYPSFYLGSDKAHVPHR